jgi:hypothetical protein
MICTWLERESTSAKAERDLIDLAPDILYRVKVTVFKLRLDNPMSSPVETAAGMTFLLYHSRLFSFLSLFCENGSRSHIVVLIRSLLGFQSRPNPPDKHSETELDDLMAHRYKQRVWEVVVLWCKHPFVVY